MPWLAAGIGAGLNVLGGLLGTNVTKTLPGNLQAAQNNLLGYYGGILQNPASGLQPMLNNGLDQINRNYQALPDLSSRLLAARGFGKSGKLGTAMYNIGASRLGDISNFQSQFNQMVLNRQAQAASGQAGLINAGYGENIGGPGAGLSAAGNEFGGLSRSLMQSRYANGGGGGGNGGGWGGGWDSSVFDGPAYNIPDTANMGPSPDVSSSIQF